MGLTPSRLPSSNAEYWTPKIDSNRRRDNRISRQLRREGFHVMRIWEHELKGRGVDWPLGADDEKAQERKRASV